MFRRTAIMAGVVTAVAVGVLVVLGVPVAAWAGVMLADVWRRRRDYDDADLYRADGRYGAVRWPAVCCRRSPTPPPRLPCSCRRD